MCSQKRYVLRKKPAGQLLSATAHQIEREYTMLRALHKHNTNSPSIPPNEIVPVPEPFILCEDIKVIGTPFYIMEFLDGRIFTDTRMLEVSPQDRREWLVATRLLLISSFTNTELVGCPPCVRWQRLHHLTLKPLVYRSSDHQLITSHGKSSHYHGFLLHKQKPSTSRPKNQLAKYPFLMS
jgi:hypothetical protein